MLDELEVVNDCLRGIGNDQVSTLEYPDTDTAGAIAVLRKKRIELCTMGWWFNTEYDWKFTPNALTGQIKFPKEVLSYRTTGASRNFNDLIIRGGKLYDKKKHTYDMSELVGQGGELSFDFILLLDFNDIPVQAQQVISIESVIRYVKEYGADKTSVQQYENEQLKVQAALDRMENRNARRNAFKSPMTRSVIGMTGSVYSNNVLGGGAYV